MPLQARAGRDTVRTEHATLGRGSWNGTARWQRNVCLVEIAALIGWARSEHTKHSTAQADANCILGDNVQRITAGEKALHKTKGIYAIGSSSADSLYIEADSLPSPAPFGMSRHVSYRLVLAEPSLVSLRVR